MIVYCFHSLSSPTIKRHSKLSKCLNVFFKLIHFISNQCFLLYNLICINTIAFVLLNKFSYAFLFTSNIFISVTYDVNEITVFTLKVMLIDSITHAFLFRYEFLSHSAFITFSNHITSPATVLIIF